MRLCKWSVSRALAAGATWTSRTTTAPWAARDQHTSVIDAAGAIYVIGGANGYGLNDVWASTDGGADRTRAGVVGGLLWWVLRGYSGVQSGTKW